MAETGAQGTACPGDKTRLRRGSATPPGEGAAREPFFSLALALELGAAGGGGGPFSWERGCLTFEVWVCWRRGMSLAGVVCEPKLSCQTMSGFTLRVELRERGEERSVGLLSTGFLRIGLLFIWRESGMTWRSFMP